MNGIQIYDDTDQRSPAEKMRAAAPAFFVDAMKKYIARNSIKINAAEFVFYCACTWDEQKTWLTADNIDWAIRYIVSDLPFPRMPADTDWVKPYQEWRAEEYRKAREAEQKRQAAMRLARPAPTPEQKQRVENMIKDTIARMNAQ